MSEQQQATIVKAVKPVKKAATAAIAKPKATHPTFFIMISEALKALNEPRSGSSRQGIVKYIMSTYGLEEKFANTRTKVALKIGVKSGNLKQVKGVGASGSFKLGDVAKKQVTKKVLIKPKEVKVVKKPAAVTSTAKKTATKTVAPAKTSPKKIKIIVKKLADPAPKATTTSTEDKPKKTVKKVVVVKAKTTSPAKPTVAKPVEAKKVVAKPAASKTKIATAKPAAAKTVAAKVASTKKSAVATKTTVIKNAAPKTKKNAPKLQANL